VKRRPLPAAAAAVAALSLLLAACGGSDDDNANADDKINGAESATPSASPSESAAGRPEIELPDDAKNVFEDTETGDPKKDAVLADNAERINSIDDAIFQGKEATEALRFYSEGKAFSSAVKFIKGWVKHGHTWVGSTRYFERTVEFQEDGSASVIYCADESDSAVRDGKTGEVDEPGAPTADSYVLYNTLLVKNADGVWQTVNVISDRGNEKCVQ
jgi:hypothetical protein